MVEAEQAADTNIDAETLAKTKELILLVIDRASPEVPLTLDSLFGLVWQCDFEAYSKLGKSITGAVYTKELGGMTSKSFRKAIGEMITAGDLDYVRGAG